jgi:predicted nucleotidyltransferase
MTQAIFNQILNQLESLNPEELKQLHYVIQQHLTTKETKQKITFHQALLASGLVKQLKQPSNTQPIKRQLIQVQNQPISETIIEERH